MTRAVDESDDVKVFILCTGNQARSPLAAVLLQRRVAELPVLVRSRGLVPVGPAGRALPEMVRAARDLGIDLRGHRARQLTPGELEGADLVIGFEPAHSAAAVIDGGASRDCVFTLAELVGLIGSVPGLPADDLRARVATCVRSANARRSGQDPFRVAVTRDPLGGSRQTFVSVAREIEAGVSEIASWLFTGAPSLPAVDQGVRSAWRRALASTVRREGGSSRRLAR